MVSERNIQKFSRRVCKRLNSSTSGCGVPDTAQHALAVAVGVA